MTKSDSPADPDDDLPSTWTAWRDSAEVTWSAWPAGASARVGVAIATSAAEGIGLGYSLKRVIEAVADGRQVLGWTVVLVVSAAIPRWLGVVWDHVQHVTLIKTQQLIGQRTMAALSRPAGVDHLESPRYADRVRQLSYAAQRVSILFDWLATQVGSGLALGVALILLGKLHPLLVIPVVLAAAIGSIQARARRQALKLMDRATAEQRVGDRLVALSTSPSDAMDVRMLGLGPWLVEAHRTSRALVRRDIVAGENKVVAGIAFAAVLQAALLTGAFAFLVTLAKQGRVGTGEVALAVVLLRSAMSQAGGIGGSVADLARNTFVARRYSWLIRHDGLLPVVDRPAPVPEALTEGIAFQDVTFTYPGADAPTLRNITIRLRPGSTVAFVGDNGAGKTTLVKLLCRFYDPSDGVITVDGTDLRNFSAEEWRLSIGGTLQDFERYLFTAGQSIGVGDVPHVDDEQTIERAARAGGAAFVEALPHGYETQLGRSFDGEELSEGQWQRVAIARGFMRTKPILVLLDEPTAALDPHAENELFERTVEGARAARDRGAVTVLVSHRFSTVRMADLIVVLADGAIAEAGSHSELLALNGKYAELYLLQAERYR